MLTNKDFINITYSFETLDRFIHRSFIFNAVKSNRSFFHGKFLDIGCGSMPYRDFIKLNSRVEVYNGVDLYNSLNYGGGMQPDFLWDGKVLPVEDSSYDVCFSTEVLEHCFNPEALMLEAFRVLRSNGIFFFTVPFIWNLHEVPNDHYRYTPFAIERHLTESGFTICKLKPFGGWHISLAQMIGLWIKRAPMRLRSRKILFFLLTPFIKFLLRKGLEEKVSFSEGQMITGFYGIARKN